MIVTRGDRYPSIYIDGSGKDEAIVVIGMFTDDINAPGGSDEPARGASVNALELTGQVGCEIG